MSKIRIDKLIANASSLSRKEVHGLVRGGRVTVQGVVVKDIGYKVESDTDTIALDGQPVYYQQFFYVMMNKPKGILSASTDKSRRTVVDVVSEKTGKKGLFPVGRLDKDTTGLILITNDGNLGHQIISPKSHIEKEYWVTLDAPVTEEEQTAFLKGITLADGQVCRPARMEPIEDSRMVCRVVITEGKYHQIKRMFGTVGIGVNELKRVRIGALKLDERLAEGDFKELSSEEIQQALKEFK